jgi:hypothetical protein
MRRLAIGAAVLAAVCCTAASRAGTVSFTSTTLSLPLSFSRPTQLALADLDGAHGQDLVVLGAHGDVGVFLNNGNGTFAMPLIGDSGCSPADSFAGGQFDGDSQLDVVVACGSSSVWHRLRGKGDGTFTAYDPLHDELPDVQPHGAGGSGGLVTGDYDGDGNLDVAVLADSGNDATSIVQLHRGDGDGAFAAPQTFATRSGSGANPQIASADLNGDGKPDLANIDSAVAAGDVTVLLNTTPAPPSALPPPPPPPPLPPPPPPPVPKVRCIVPRVIGKTVAQARTALHTHHCRLGTVGLRYSKVKRGHVLSQSRAPGLVRPVLTKVNVVVSRGRRPI